MVTFNYGSWEHFLTLTKSSEGLYILDNGLVYRGEELLSTIHAVFPGWTFTLICEDETGFIIESDLNESNRNHFYFSLVTGEIRYVDDDLEYVSITELCLDSILINQEFLTRLIAAIADVQEITMPTLTVQGLKLVWTASNVGTFKTFTPKNQ